jgi:hypothetical protein
MKPSVIRYLAIAFALSLTAACTQPAGESEESYSVEIDPSEFVLVVDNPYYPLTPGMTYIYEDVRELERIEVTVTHDRRMVMGVSCIVVHDQVTVDGEVIEDTFDWFAQDRDGNVWYFGEDSREIDDGEVVSTEGSWEAGVRGALPGIIMPADPTPGEIYRQEYFFSFAEDMAEVVSLSESTTVPYGSYDDLLMTREWTRLEPDISELKYYARGIGLVLVTLFEGVSERVELLEIRSN